MKRFHRAVFKGPSFADAGAQASAHLMSHGEYELAEAARTMAEFGTEGFTQLYWGKLEPRPYNDGYTHFVRVKWYGA